MAQTNRNIDNMSPFITFCQHVIPLSYDESLSYYETLCALRNYIGQMVEAVNNNADAVTELQGLFEKLKNYVDNYFKNLDVQTEINNKLDEMATDGTLDEIINTQIFGELNNKVDGLESDNTNIKNDITNLKNDITNLKNEDTQIKQDITNNTNEINNVKESIENLEKQKICLVIGDSYTDDSSNARQLRDGAESWVNIFKRYTNLNVINLADSGSGFVATGDRGTTFLSQLQNWTNENGNLKADVESIIIYGGINDIDKSHTSEIESAFNTFTNYINTNYQKSKKILFYFNLPNRLINNSEVTILNNVINKAISLSFTSFKACGWLGGKNGECFASDNYHPNNKGSQRIFECVNSLINGGKSPCIPVTLSNMMLDYPSSEPLQPSEYNINSKLYYYPTLNKCEGVANIKLTGHNVNNPNTSAQWSLKSDLTIGALPYYVPCPTNYSTTGGDNHKCVMFGNSGYETNYMKLWISIDNNSQTTVTFNTLAVYINYVFC